MEEDTTPYLHIYGQELWHDPATILGTLQGLVALREAITLALSRPDGIVEASVFASDGEEYAISVRCVTTLKEYALPYILI